MAGTSYHPEHAQRVIEVAKSELESLIRQQIALGKKVKEVKRTVRGLTVLFGKEADSSEEDERGSSRPESFAGQPHNFKGRVTLRTKFERACRIALLESEEAASAEQIYDRIIRRGSYRLVGYKHPLAQIIKMLDLLEKRGQVRAFEDRNCRRWRWGFAEPEVEGPAGAVAVENEAIGSDSLHAQEVIKTVSSPATIPSRHLANAP